uniref:Ironsulfur cluster assembly protein putative n=1 Tax=Albugo laibachii Nc14 TaxID=890382 RepID=F0WWM2_9STRA|nr:ironsulfur cluster assembly protein putative [Albugo laibachii Nc14]|eukprot:CCA25846.1 ironsulfur cluster assembly protein putative [Albugo laibachii Nc14]
MLRGYGGFQNENLESKRCVLSGKRMLRAVQKRLVFCMHAPNVRFLTNESHLPDLIITPDAAKKLIENRQQQKNENLLLRLAVEGGGCSGFQYAFNFEDVADINKDEDTVFDQHGGKVVVDKESLDLIRGSTLDYEQKLIRSAFVVQNNPKAISGCGCGVSFDLKD